MRLYLSLPGGGGGGDYVMTSTRGLMLQLDVEVWSWLNVDFLLFATEKIDLTQFDNKINTSSIFFKLYSMFEINILFLIIGTSKVAGYFCSVSENYAKLK